MRTKYGLAVAILLLTSRAAHAECVASDRATPASTCVVLERDGRTVVQFDQETAIQLGREHAEVPLLRQQVTELEAANAERQRQAALLEQANADRAASNERLNSALRQSMADTTAETHRASKAEDALGAWYRSPLFWLGVGAVLGGGVVVAVTR
jgi:hypothetical protein